MRFAPFLACLAAFVTATPAVAADLARPYLAPPAPVIAVSPYGCILGAPIQYSRAPREATEGTLPVGVAVQILDLPYDPRADLYVRLAAPNSSIYYGWVNTRGLICH